jgi:CP family cyanate transporter-like MFS transporter
LGRGGAGGWARLALGRGLRAIDTYPALLLGTALLGTAIGVANVLVPALIKGSFPTRVGPLTSLYGSLMVVAATVSAGVAVPVADRAGWPVSLALWAAPAAVAAVVVLLSVVVDDRGTDPDERARATAARRAEDGVPARVLHRSPLAWQVTAFMGLQSVLFYVVLAWLPDILVERGMTDARAGLMVSVLNVGGLLGVLTAPLLAGRRTDQRWHGAVAGVLTTVGIGLLLVPGTALAPLASAVFGVGAGATVGLAFAFFSLRTSSARDAAALSGMAQTWGYLVSAFGPLAWGALRDASSSWTPALVVLLGVAIATTVAGHLSGRDRTLDVTSLSVNSA